MISTLIKLANNLDQGGHRKEADRLDSVINKIAEWGLGAIPEAQPEAQPEVSSGPRNPVGTGLTPRATVLSLLEDIVRSNPTLTDTRWTGFASHLLSAMEPMKLASLTDQNQWSDPNSGYQWLMTLLRDAGVEGPGVFMHRGQDHGKAMEFAELLSREVLRLMESGD